MQGGEFSELAIKLGEEKALSMAEDLCEGAADDKGIIAYNDVPFHYANVGAALNQVQTRAHLKRAVGAHPNVLPNVVANGGITTMIQYEYGLGVLDGPHYTGVILRIHR